MANGRHLNWWWTSSNDNELQVEKDKQCALL
jgi:hypothetical protein